MTMTADAARLFADARDMHAAALAQFDAGDVRDAAEKAWCATKRATDGLILARIGEEPPKSPDATRALRTMAAADSSVRPLSARYFESQGALHGDCFYSGMCEPLEDTERLIRETADYIADAERLAES